MQNRIAMTVTMLVGVAGSCWAGVNVERLRCEYLNDPLGIDVTEPRLSWIVQSDERGQKQTAYQVLVASTPELLANDQGDLWDSGRVESDQTIHVEYAGKPLVSRDAVLLESPGVGQGRPAVAVEQAGLLDDGPAEAVRLGGASGSPMPMRPRRRRSRRTTAITASLPRRPTRSKWVAVDLGDRPQDRRRAALSGPAVRFASTRPAFCSRSGSRSRRPGKPIFPTPRRSSIRRPPTCPTRASRRRSTASSRSRPGMFV